MIDWSRVLAEKRSLIIPIVLAAIANIAFYAVVIYPLSSSAGAVEARAQAAAAALARASADLKAAEATRVGRERADEQLVRFYDEILPKDQTGARRITYLRLAKMAEEANLDFERRSMPPPKQERDRALTRMEITLGLTGDYRDVRGFIHRLETSPEFVVIEDVSLARGEEESPLTLTLRLATYFKAR